MCDHLEKEHSRRRKPTPAPGEGLRLAGCSVREERLGGQQGGSRCWQPPGSVRESTGLFLVREKPLSNLT